MALIISDGPPFFISVSSCDNSINPQNRIVRIDLSYFKGCGVFSFLFPLSSRKELIRGLGLHVIFCVLL